MKRILISIFAIAAVVSMSAQNIECKFQQTRFIKASGKTIGSEGSLKLNIAADRLEMNYTKPAGDYFNINGKTISVNIRGKKSVIDTDKNAAMRLQRNTLMDCISGNWKKAATDNNAESSVTEKGANKVVKLTARKTGTRGYAKITITYRKSDNLPVELVLEEFNGTTTTYKMTDITKK